MNKIVAINPALPAMSDADICNVSLAESHLRSLEQVPIKTTHHFHAGMYARTVCVPKGIIITGVLIRIPTMLIISGHATAYIGGGEIELCGYHVLPGSAGRKQMFFAHEDTYLTMIFPSKANTVEEAEAEFTDEIDLLVSHQQTDDLVFITGE